MISRGELLELLADSDQRWRRLHARCVLRPQHYPPTQVSFHTQVAVRREPGPEVTCTVDATTQPYRLRVERVPDGGAAGAVPDLAVDDGSELWLQTGDEVQQRRGRSEPFVTGVSRLLLPRGLSARHRLTVLGDGEAAGRDCWRVRADAVPDALPAGDLDGELLIDQETGLVLAQQWRRAGDLVSSARMTELVVDGPAEPELFVYARPPGVRVAAPGMRVPTRYAPALVLGLAAAMAGEGVARLGRLVGIGSR